jgi:hypothetical protein
VRFRDEHDWHDEYDPRDDAEKGYCAGCHEWVTGTLVDYGIGDYEYWGCRGTHVDLEWVSPCCEEELLNKLPEEENDDDDDPD